MGSWGFIISRKTIVAYEPLPSKKFTTLLETEKFLQLIEEFLKPPSELNSCISFKKKSFGETSSCSKIFEMWKWNLVFL